MVAHDKSASKLPSREDLLAELRPPCDLAKLQSHIDRRPQHRADSLRHLLQICAEVGNEKLVEALLMQGAKPDAFNKNTWPPILCAAKAGHTGTIALLIRYGSRVDVADSSGKTALMLAAALDNVEVLEFLVGLGAKLDAVDRRARTVAMHAAMSDSTKTLKWLMDRGADITFTDSQQKTALLHAVSAYQARAVQLLLDSDADVSVSDLFGRNALIQAAANNDPVVLSMLLKSGCDPNRPDSRGRSPLAHAILSMKVDSPRKIQTVNGLLDAGAIILDNAESLECLLSAGRNGLNNVLHALLSHGANANAADANGWSVLMRLASESSEKRKWNKQTIKWLLDYGADVYKVDYEKGVDRERTPLQWAAAMGHTPMVEAILESMQAETAQRYVNRQSYRQKTALHLAAQNGHADVVRALLDHHADVHATSEGSWTALLIAAKAGNHRVIDELLKGKPPANVNARTSSGMTALHWAAENGHIEVIERLLKERDLKKNPSDSFDTTPVLRASQHGHKEIIKLLTPHLFARPESLYMRNACDMFHASVVDFHVRNGKVINRKVSVQEVLFQLEREHPDARFAVTTNLDRVKTTAKDEDRKESRPNFRWIHLPANNLLWAELVITKMLVEDGPIDVTGFQSMLRLFGQQQHRGIQPHSRYMRPYCQLYQGDGIVRPRPVPRLSISDSTFMKTRASATTFEETPVRERRLETPRSSRRQQNSPLTDHITASPTNSRHGSTTQLDSDLDEKPSREVGVVFMPYLHWETDSNRVRMRNAMQATQKASNPVLPISIERAGRDECLIKGYLKHHTDFHPRRTLDQFKHSSINTDKRDRDQVVYRHFRDAHAGARHSVDPKIFMVDQMWIWTFDDVILTCFPERWDQPKRDRLNVFDGVLSDITSRSFPPVKSVHDVLSTITHRCIGSFDRHEWGSDDQNFMFFEIFELSIGTLTRRTTALLQRFERDATNTAKWLNRRSDEQDDTTEAVVKGDEIDDRENEEDEFLREKRDDKYSRTPHGNPVFVNRLLNISKETELLIECKDIEDELSILQIVLEQQKEVLRQMSEKFKLLKKRAGLQKRLVEQDLTDIERMQKQAVNVNRSLTQVLDLKQKHANAIEARFARDQAMDTARQGKTIMVFTLVTIVFLPLSFMAAFFAINISQFPHDPANGGSGLDIGWVSKYVFGIGLAVSVPLITLAFLISDMDSLTWRLKRWFRQGRKKPSQISPPMVIPSITTDAVHEKRASHSLDEYRPTRRLTRKWTDHTDGSLHTSVNEFPV